MNLKTMAPQELSWNLDFQPRHPWPEFLPVFASPFNGQLHALSGFDRRSRSSIGVLILEASAAEICAEVYRNLAPFEELRLQTLLSISNSYGALLELPNELQEYCDERSVPLKALKPLEHLKEWTSEITRTFTSVKPSSSQVRELVDLFCDLKFQGKSWSECALSMGEPQKWIFGLRKLRFPLSYNTDAQAIKAIQTLPWPRGVQAKWERHGDQAGVSIQAKINSSRDWKSLKESFGKLELEDSVWKT